jgi:hypothetical protein
MWLIGVADTSMLHNVGGVTQFEHIAIVHHVHEGNVEVRLVYMYLVAIGPSRSSAPGSPR